MCSHHAFGLLPGGTGLALPLTFRAITMKTITDAIALLPGANPVFMPAGLGRNSGHLTIRESDRPRRTAML